MTLVEFAEKVLPMPLMDWQKQFLAACEQTQKENKYLIYIPPRVNGKRMLIQIIDEFEKEQAMSNAPHACRTHNGIHICDKCKSCGSAIEITTYADALRGVRNYVQGIGECEYLFNQKNSAWRNEYQNEPVIESGLK